MDDAPDKSRKSKIRSLIDKELRRVNHVFSDFCRARHGFVGQGTITTSTATVDVSYTNALGISFFQNGSNGETDYWAQGGGGSLGRNPAKSPYTSSLVDNIPVGTDIIALRFAGSQTLTFSQAVANPVFSYVSLNGNGYGFIDQDFDILSFGHSPNDIGYWGDGTSFKQVVDLGGGHFEYELLGTGEPHGTIRFKGAFATLDWISLSNENWNGFTVGVQGTAQEVFTPEPSSLVLLSIGLVVGISRSYRRRYRV